MQLSIFGTLNSSTVKNITILLLCILFYLISSCIKGSKTIIEPIANYKYIYLNSTDHSIKITQWESRTGQLLYTLNTQDTLEFSLTLPFGKCHVNSVNRNTRTCSLIDSDSLRIDFEDSKFYILRIIEVTDPNTGFTEAKGSDLEIDILNLKNYDSTQIGNTWSYKYTFTEKDYSYAK